MTDTLLGANRASLEKIITADGFKAYRAGQLLHWIYRRGAHSYAECANLPKRMVQYLEGALPTGIRAPLTVHTSRDGTKKYLFPVAGPAGDAAVESALIPDGNRLTLCLSTQIGCRRACSFCQTGRQGFNGNLSIAEIVNQYHSLPERDAVTNIVYMGMGEPLDNEEALFGSLETFTDPDRGALSPRRITVSTVGILPALERFLEESDANLAVSLHSPIPEERAQIMAVEREHPIRETMRLIRDGRHDRKRRITFEYTLFAGVNDQSRHVDEIVRLLGGLRTRVNLIRYHRLEKSKLEPVQDEAMDRFARALRERGIRTFIRASRGEDINAACGMLWTKRPGVTDGA